MGARASIAESILTTGSEPVIVDATTAHGYVPVPAAEAGADLQRTATNSDTVVFTPVLELPNDPLSTPRDEDDETNSVSSAPETSVERQLSQRRRETARRLAHILKEQERTSPDSTGPPVHLRPSPARQPTIISEKDWMSRLERSRQGSIQDLKVSPVMVVADINPSDEAARSQLHPEAGVHNRSTQVSGEPGIASLDRMTYTQLREPVPTSSSSSSRGQGEAMTSPLGDKMQLLHQKVEPMASPYLKQGSGGVSAEPEASGMLFAEPPSTRSTGGHERDIAMEARLSRLERNGDMWLGAVVPLLESIDRSLARMSGREAWGPPQQQPVALSEPVVAAETEGEKERPKTWPENDTAAPGHKRALSEAERLGLPSALAETQIPKQEPLGQLAMPASRGGQGRTQGAKETEPRLAARMRAAWRSMGRREGEETEDEAVSRSRRSHEREYVRPRRSRSQGEAGMGGHSGLSDNTPGNGSSGGVAATGSGSKSAPRTPPLQVTYRGVTGLFRRPTDSEEVRRR